MFIPRTARQFVVLCFLFGATSCSPVFPHTPSVASLGNLPLVFVRCDEFSARGQGYFIRLDPGTATIQALPTKGSDKSQFLSIGFSGGRKAAPVPGLKLSGLVNYIWGNDSRNWEIGLSTVDRMIWPEVYRAIDVVYYGNQQQLELDLVVKPGGRSRGHTDEDSGRGKTLDRQ